MDYEALARQAHPIRVAVLFGIASAVVLALVYFIMIQVGLPDWVFVGAVILLAIGLPVMLMTGHHDGLVDGAVCGTVIGWLYNTAATGGRRAAA